MKSFFNFKNQFAKERISFGLDIGTQTTKLVKLRFAKDIVELCGFEFEPTQETTQEVLKKIRQSTGADSLNLSVSGQATVIRYVNFTNMNKEELHKALKFEAQKHIPFSVEEVNLDACILKDNLPDNKMLILLAAVKKELVNQRIKMMEEASMRVNLIDIDSLALVNAFDFNYLAEEQKAAKTVALLNIGASMSNLDIVDDGSPRLSRDIHIAGNNFTQKLADIFAKDFKSAEEMKINPQADEANKVAAAVESVLANLAGEIRTSFDYYESQNASSVGKIFLSGGGSKFTNLKDMLSNLLGIEVEYWDPLKNITIAEGLDQEKIKAYSGQLAVAVGVALR